MTPSRGPGRDADTAPGRGLVLVVCKAARRVDLLRRRTLAPVGHIGLSGATGHEVATVGTSAFVPIYGSGVVGALEGNGRSVDVLDLSRRSLSRTIELPRDAHPHDVRPMADGRLLLTCEGRSSVAILEPGSASLEEVPLPFPTGHMVLTGGDPTRAWVLHARPGAVVEVDLVARRATRWIRVAPGLHRAALDAGGDRLFAAEQGRPCLTEVDLTTMTVTGRTDLPGVAFGCRATPDGQGLLVVLRERSSLAFLDLATRRVLDELPLPHHPQSVVIDPDGDLAYVSCAGEDVVVVVDLTTRRVLASAAVGAGADGMAAHRDDVLGDAVV